MADPIDLVAKRRLTWPQRIVGAVALLLLGAGVAGLVVALSAKDEAGEATKKVNRAGPPCVDVAPGPDVRPSEGCEDVYRLLVEKCARDPAFCRRSERQAVKAAQQRSADREIGPLAQRPEGGGGTPGPSPRSPRSPSREPRRGGDDGGGDERLPDRPNRPDRPPDGEPQPNQPQPQPQPGPSGPPGPPGPPAPPVPPPVPGPVGRLVEDVDRLLEPVVPDLPRLPDLLGPRQDDETAP